ncbi:MAG: WG repeat-containing protein [bacterium]
MEKSRKWQRLFIAATGLILFAAIGCTAAGTPGGFYNNGLAAVRYENAWGYVDTDGTVIVDFQYDEAFAFERGVAIVMDNDEAILIDATGTVIASANYDLLDIDDETGLVWYKKAGKIGLLNRSGAVLVAGDYAFPAWVTMNVWAPAFHEGRAVMFDGAHYGFIDTIGTWVIEPTYAEAGDFCFDLAPVRLGDKWGYIDEIGNVAIEFLYDEAASFGERGLALVTLAGDEALIKTDGMAVLSGFYRIVITADMIFGTIGEIHGLYDQNGTLLVSFSRTIWNFEILNERFIRFFEVMGTTNAIYDGDGQICREYASGSDEAPDDWMAVDKEIWFIFETGTTVTLSGEHKTFTIDAEAYVAPATGYQIIASRDGLLGVVGFKGNVVVDFIYAGIGVTADGYFLVSPPDTAAFGCLDRKGRTVLSAIYNDIRVGQ